MAAGTLDDMNSAREEVWLALSMLYLDTDIDGLLPACAQTLAASPYSREALAQLLFDEVHPALVYNLMSAAGVWDGFDRDWLCAHIRQRKAAWWAPIHVARWLRRADIRARWQRLDAIISALRATDSQS